MFFKKKTAYTLKIAGMHCVNCQNKVYKAISLVKGVKDVKVNLETKEAVFLAKENFELEKVLKAVEEAGFTAIK